MGKRSDFSRIPRDYYPTPREAVLPLIDHLPKEKISYWEPCAGAGDLVRHLGELAPWLYCSLQTDIDPQSVRVVERDAMNCFPSGPHLCITNPPWDRKVLHPMIEHFCVMRPTWLLFDADWMHTRQSAQFMPWLKKVVSIGRVKWIPDSKMTGKDNCAWYLFDAHHNGPTEFVGRTPSAQRRSLAA